MSSGLQLTQSAFPTRPSSWWGVGVQSSKRKSFPEPPCWHLTAPSKQGLLPLAPQPQGSSLTRGQTQPPAWIPFPSVSRLNTIVDKTISQPLLCETVIFFSLLGRAQMLKTVSLLSSPTYQLCDLGQTKSLRLSVLTSKTLPHHAVKIKSNHAWTAPSPVPDTQE